jgi:hypothetical protein
MISAVNLKDKDMLTTLLKTIGFGFAATGFQDHFLEDGEGTSYFNLIAMVVGTVAWSSGLILEKMEAERVPPRIAIKKSTAIIQQALSHSGGFGLVAGITHFIKKVDTESGKWALINMACMSPVAIRELYVANHLPPTIPWEKIRGVVLIASDYFLAAGAKGMMNNSDYSPFNIISLILGFFISMAEAVYGIRHDRGLTFQNILNRRLFKIVGGVNFIFMLQDIVKLDSDRYTIADDVYLTIGSVLLFMTLLELRDIAIVRRNEMDAEREEGVRLYMAMIERRVADAYAQESAEEKKDPAETRIIDVTDLDEVQREDLRTVAFR